MDKIKTLLIMFVLFIGLSSVQAIEFEETEDIVDDSYIEMNNEGTKKFVSDTMDQLNGVTEDEKKLISEETEAPIYTYGNRTKKDEAVNFFDKFKTIIKQNNFYIFLICLIPGIITATILFIIYYLKNNMIKKSYYAKDYLVKDSVKIIDMGKSHIGTSTSKREKPFSEGK